MLIISFNKKEICVEVHSEVPEKELFHEQKCSLFITVMRLEVCSGQAFN